MKNINNSRSIETEELLKFLKDKIGLTKEALELGIRQSNIENAPLAIVLWSFGLINVQEYNEVIKWQYENKKEKI